MLSSAGHRHKDTSVTFDHCCPESSGSSGPAAAHPASSVTHDLQKQGTFSTLKWKPSGIGHRHQSSQRTARLPLLYPLWAQRSRLCSPGNTPSGLYSSLNLEAPETTPFRKARTCQATQPQPALKGGGPACVPLQPSLRKRRRAVSPSP